jgi:hypothetical protein
MPSSIFPCLQEVAMGYKENNEVHFLTVGIDQEKEFEAADVLYFTYDGEEIFVSSVSYRPSPRSFPSECLLTRLSSVQAPIFRCSFYYLLSLLLSPQSQPRTLPTSKYPFFYVSFLPS